jgi:hypothetical protein
MASQAGQGPDSEDGPALEVMRRVLEEAGLPVEPLPNESGFSTKFEDPSTLDVTGIAIVYEDVGRFVWYMEPQVRAVGQAVEQVVEFITRANFGLLAGNFELDYETGIVRFKTVVGYAGDRLRALYVRQALLDAMDAVETYSVGLVAVAAGRISAREAIEQIEGA